MHVKISDLENIVHNVITEEKIVRALKEEAFNVLGPSVNLSGGLPEITDAINERLDVLERTGRSNVRFKTSLLLKLKDSNHVSARKLAARALPEKLAERMLLDRDSSVRVAAARHCQLNLVKEAVRTHKNDDELSLVYKNRLTEEGLPKPKSRDQHLVMYDEALGDAVKQPVGPELSDVWYANMAAKFLQDYGTSLSTNSNNLAIARYVSSVQATTGVEIDLEKLRDAIVELIESAEDNIIDENVLFETATWLDSQDLLTEDSENDDLDEVNRLLSRSLTSAEYVEEATRLFSVRESTLPPAVKKFLVNEGQFRKQTIPVVGVLPHDMGLRVLDETALDKFVSCWNSLQELKGEPIQIEWFAHPSSLGKIGFSAVLK